MQKWGIAFGVSIVACTFGLLVFGLILVSCQTDCGRKEQILVAQLAAADAKIQQITDELEDAKKQIMELQQAATTQGMESTAAAQKSVPDPGSLVDQQSNGERPEITVQHFVVAPEQYEKKVFVRTVYCGGLKEGNFPGASRMALLGLKADKVFRTICHFDFGDSVETFELLVTKQQAMIMLGEYLEDGTEGINYVMEGVALWFTGLKESSGEPVFYVKQFPKQLAEYEQ